jgi:hypothetical protein
MDVREANAITRSLSHFPLQAAFRYNRRATDAPKLELEWQQFSDADVLSAVAERATVTTLTNVEGRSLTEVTLRIRNHSQAFVKVELPPGAQLVTAEVEGQTVKPVDGGDGSSRVPLLRAGLNASGSYTVSFVYLSTGGRFGKTGTYDMGLPRLDVPISLLTWEVSLPERLEVKQFGGNALSAEVFPAAAQSFLADEDDLTEVDNRLWTRNDLSSLEAGEIGGIVVDPNGAVVPGAEVTAQTQSGASFSASTDGEGRWVIAGLPPGPVKVRIAVPGFKTLQQDFYYSGSKPVRMGNTLEVAAVTETVTVTANGVDGMERENKRIEDMVRKNRPGAGESAGAPSQNVFNLQRRVAGILPVRIEVPRSGRSYRFVRPLILGEETKIAFQYKSK